MQICQVAGLLFMVFPLRALMFCFTSADVLLHERS